MARQRDYQAEYRGRIERGLERGLTRSQARGHPRRGERLLSEPSKRREPHYRPKVDDRIVSTIMDLPALGLTRAAKKHSVAPGTVSRVGHTRGWLGKEYRTSKRGKSVFSGWRVTAQVTAPVLETDGTYYEGVGFDLRNGRTIGRYWNAVQLLRDGKPSELRHMGTVEIVDTEGRRYRLMANPNAVLAYYESLSDEERERFGQNIGSEKVTVHRGRAA